MPFSILTTKLHIPPRRAELVSRERLTKRLDRGLSRRWTLVSAPAGFGKSTLVSTWAATSGRPVAWLSLDADDNDLSRFLVYMVSALRSVKPEVGGGLLEALQSPQPPPPEVVLTGLVNALASSGEPLLLVLDDYHLLDSPPVDQALAFFTRSPATQLSPGDCYPRRPTPATGARPGQWAA